MTDENNNATPRRGRKSIVINFPTIGEFSVSDVLAANPSVSKVSVQLKINGAVKEGRLKPTSKQRSGGRPKQLFTLA